MSKRVSNGPPSKGRRKKGVQDSSHSAGPKDPHHAALASQGGRSSSRSRRKRPESSATPLSATPLLDAAILPDTAILPNTAMATKARSPRSEGLRDLGGAAAGATKNTRPRDKGEQMAAASSTPQPSGAASTAATSTKARRDKAEGSKATARSPKQKSSRNGRKSSTRNVIHVVFGPGGGRVSATAPEARPRTRSQDTSSEPLTDLFTQTEIARLLGMTLARLRTLDRSGIVSPSGRRRGRRAYTFADLIQLRAAQSLLTSRVRLRDVSRAVLALRRTLPTVARPLAELRIVSDGRDIVVKTRDGNFDALSGQQMLDFEVRDLRADVVRVLRPAAGKDRARTAYELYLKASQLDEDPATMSEAEQLYQKAIELDPWLTIAYTNLGNICFRRQEMERAEALYRRALELDSRQPEAQYNLGYVMLEHGEPQASIPLFLGAIEADPKFADAYFNLAMAYEQAGQTEKARPYWSNYIKLEPSGTWTEIAKRHL